MRDLPEMRCDEKCEGVYGCNFGLQGKNTNSDKILLVLNNPDKRIIKQPSLFGSSYEQMLFGTKTGRIIDEILDYCQLTREQITITNLFKGILETKEEPRISEHEKCLDILIKQIELFSPEKIIIFGRQGKQLLQEASYNFKKNCYFSHHPSYIWAQTINKEKRLPYYQKIKEFLEINL